VKKLTFILSCVLLIATSITLLSATPEKRTMTMAKLATSNPSGDWIYVHLWNGTNGYNFSVPPFAGPGDLGLIEDGCNYSVTLSSGGGPHTMQFYWFYASNTTSATQSGGMCLTCSSCPTLRIYN
jgi:hypothetical protein